MQADLIRAIPSAADEVAREFSLRAEDRDATHEAELRAVLRRVFGDPTRTVVGHGNRLHAAQRLLREASRSIADIAHECGYADHSAFTRAFRAMTSVTPAHFRAGGRAG